MVALSASGVQSRIRLRRYKGGTHAKTGKVEQSTWVLVDVIFKSHPRKQAVL